MSDASESIRRIVERLPSKLKRRIRLKPLQIRLVHGDITDETLLGRCEHPLDVISVGHYQGVRPGTAGEKLGRAVSRTVWGADPEDCENLLRTFVDRGVMKGELGRMFLLPDPRPERSLLFAFAGMGLPGRCGHLELAILVRELVWTIYQLKKRHLATVLIGSGKGNLPMPEAVAAWLDGLGRAQDAGCRLETLTFVEYDPARIDQFHQALLQGTQNVEEIDYRPLSEELLERHRQEGLDQEIQRLRKRRIAAPSEVPEIPDYLTIANQGNFYSFGAMTQEAARPEREASFNREIIEQANRELMTTDLKKQWSIGQFLYRLLIPEDFRSPLQSQAPLVLALDRKAAEICWEMFVPLIEDRPQELPDDDHVDTGAFWAISRGLTRQLQTPFAPPPEPLTLRNEFRILVVVGPGLQGAIEEGRKLAKLFKSHSDKAGRKIRCDYLEGDESTPMEVLKHLMLGAYDMLHVAAHCWIEGKNAHRSGWILKGGKLTIRELKPLDRVPKFIFANACQSGVMEDLPIDQQVTFAPGFAEAFFARGVANFVCTAWKVEDQAAKDFAVEFYESLFAREERIRDAMKQARQKLIDEKSGLASWGAYQHYGNPEFRLFS